MTDVKLPRIAYVTTYDERDLHAWSGVVHTMARCLGSAGFELEMIGMSEPATLRTKAMKLAWRAAGARLLRDREPLVTKGFAAQAMRRLESVDHDIIFSPGTIAIAHLKTPKPIVYWTDSTFDGMVDYYPEFAGLSRRTLRNGHALEQSALDRCSLALFPSQWAVNSAIENYHVDPSKLQVVPFGSNVADPPSHDEVLTAIDLREPELCQLLWVGAEWERKGGEVAFATAEAMNRAGVRTDLQVIGARPPRPLPSFVKVHGFVSRHDPAGRRQLADLYTRAHFALGPSDAEAFGVAFADACCYGVPVLAADTGGVGDNVRDGVNGHLLPQGASGQAYARMALDILKDPNEYRRLASGARNEYETRLNWGSAGAHVRQLITELNPSTSGSTLGS
jgi:glycosyltransferase involved in cell wall biosynthesis